MFDISSYLTRTAERFPDRPSLYEDDALIATFFDLENRVAILAHDLRVRLGLRAGDRVGLYGKNSARYIMLMLAIWRAGLTVVPINARLHPKEVSYILQNSGARVLFTDAVDGFDSREIPLLGMETAATDWRQLPMPANDDLDSDPAIAWLFYTSGTTGRPKGVVLTHDILRQVFLNYLADVDSIVPDDCVIHFGALSHGSGMHVLPHIMCGAANVVPRRLKFDAAGLGVLFARYRGITSFMAPTMIRHLLDLPEFARLPLTNIKTIVYGGGPMYVADIVEALDKLGNRFVQIYGQGESPMTITCLRRSEIFDACERRDYDRLGSVGRSFSGVEVAVCDGSGNALPHGEIGEILVRGPTVMQGYWRNPSATAETIRDGWLFTGDMGQQDPAGFVTLKDRSKDMIVTGGFNVYPREIEEILLRHPAVCEVSVVGQQNAEWGEIIVAFVACHRGMIVTDSELDALCLDNLARFKRPKQYRFLDELPKNNYGKILKRDLRESLDRISA
ncbi:class I adenylate-forming enzyme family protein [Govanella unica]|uniref:3-methylmercaptopropionyl-CoA ligase n=1 Tax=Govanella unica TaxID=2975056 RepID=A0A9X3TYN4_9PROT|nr:AMP-binding protein [Govania unica]MDA5194048.1 AMP-binding protein [Govania unica]